MTLPRASTIVVTPGISPSTSCDDPLATTSEARLDTSPRPPTTGNISAAVSTLASRQHQASLISETATGGRSDMVYRVMGSARARTRAGTGPDVQENGFVPQETKYWLRDCTVVPKKSRSDCCQNAT